MRRYYRWKCDLISPYLGPRVLEVGCGTGFLMEQIEGRELLTGVDWDPACVERAKVRFAGRAAVEIRQMDVQQPEFLALRELNLSTVLFVNCLEMVEDGRLALQQAAAILQPRGRVVILAAALPELTGALDHAVLQHRYSRADLDSLLAACGLQILELKYVNLLGALAWWWDSQVLKRRAVPHSTYRMRDLAVPVARLLDRLTGPPVGRSLLAVGEKV